MPVASTMVRFNWPFASLIKKKNQSSTSLQTFSTTTSSWECSCSPLCFSLCSSSLAARLRAPSPSLLPTGPSALALPPSRFPSVQFLFNFFFSTVITVRFVRLSAASGQDRKRHCSRPSAKADLAPEEELCGHVKLLILYLISKTSCYSCSVKKGINNGTLLQMSVPEHKQAHDRLSKTIKDVATQRSIIEFLRRNRRVQRASSSASVLSETDKQYHSNRSATIPVLLSPKFAPIVFRSRSTEKYTNNKKKKNSFSVYWRRRIKLVKIIEES